MFLRTAIELYDFSSGPSACTLCILDYWTKHANKKEIFGHKDELYRTKQTFVELGFLGVHSDDKLIFLTLFLTFTDSTTWRVSVWLVFVAELCTQIIAWYAFSVKLF